MRPNRKLNKRLLETTGQRGGDGPVNVSWIKHRGGLLTGEGTSSAAEVAAIYRQKTFHAVNCRAGSRTFATLVTRFLSTGIGQC